MEPFAGDMPSDRYFCGLDLGQAMDFSAFVALRRREAPDPTNAEKRVKTFTTRGIKRWPLKTPYPQIVADVVALVSKPPLSGCTLGVDRTGCGQPVVDMLKAAKPAAKVVPVLITVGHQATQDGPGWNVPKSELVSCVNVLLQTDRLSIPASCGEQAEVLGKELLAFRSKITLKGNEQFEADWRSRQHDDLVLALTIAAWLGNRNGSRLFVHVLGGGGRPSGMDRIFR